MFLDVVRLEYIRISFFVWGGVGKLIMLFIYLLKFVENCVFEDEDGGERI